MEFLISISTYLLSIGRSILNMKEKVPNIENLVQNLNILLKKNLEESKSCNNFSLQLRESLGK